MLARHSEFLAGSWTVDATFDVGAAREDASNVVRFRRAGSWATAPARGRQGAGVLLDNWLKGRRRAVGLSKSDKLIEDAQRDWSALGMERLLITPLARFRQGTSIRWRSIPSPPSRCAPMRGRKVRGSESSTGWAGLRWVTV
jgi:hypothetical protein